MADFAQALQGLPDEAVEVNQRALIDKGTVHSPPAEADAFDVDIPTLHSSPGPLFW